MVGRDSGYGGIGSNGHGSGNGHRFDELDALSDEDLELLVGGGVEDEEELRSLAEETEDGDSDDAGDVATGSDEPTPTRRRTSSEPREAVGLRLFPDWEYEPASEATAEPDESVGAEDGVFGGNGDGARAGIARARLLLAPVEDALRAEGFYAYGTLDDQNRWTVAVDDEAGRVDVWIGSDGFVLDLRTTSPGTYADVDHPFRRRRMERAVRETLPRVASGYLQPHQTTEWDEVDQGVAVGLRYVVPFGRADQIGRIARSRLPELEDLLTLVERNAAR